MDNADSTIFNFFVKSFEEDKYDDVKKFLENYKEAVKKSNDSSKEQIQKAVDYIICLGNNYSIIKWAAQNSDIEALYLIKDYLSPENLQKAISHNNYEAFNKFIADSRSVSLLGFYDKEVFKAGLKFFYDCYSNKRDDVNHDEKSNAFYDTIHSNLEIHKSINEDITEQLLGLEAEILQ
jgi:hypothetical protein